ncbi:hypothetical protein [Streptacidiphilus sp. PAMC 29251]
MGSVVGFSDGSGVLVHPEALDAEAGVFNAAALAVESGAQRARAALAETGAALAGWSSGAALADCAAAWAQCLSGLSAALDRDADGLRATARNYREADAGAARQFAPFR